MNTQIITASEIQMTDVLIDKNGCKAFISLINKGEVHVVIRANGQLAAVPLSRKLRIKAREI